mgnify:CR=1 FL=1
MRLVDADAFAMYLQLVCKGNDMSAEKKVFSANGIIHMLQDMPTASDMKWTPVSEKIPSNAEEVIVTWVNHEPAPYYAHVKDVPFTGFAVYYNENWYWWTSASKDLLEEYGDRFDLVEKVDDAIEITAWMPMPDPYEVKNED